MIDVTAHICTIASPVGPLGLEATGEALSRLRLNAQDAPSDPPRSGVLAEAAGQLDAYFSGRLHVFDLPLAPRGTPFQTDVWQALREIPYGATWSYRELARHIGRPSAIRAVGAANGQNPIAIIIPCHRVIGTSGKLVGFGGGLAMKQWLLTLEGRRLF